MARRRFLFDTETRDLRAAIAVCDLKDGTRIDGCNKFGCVAYRLTDFEFVIVHSVPHHCERPHAGRLIIRRKWAGIGPPDYIEYGDNGVRFRTKTLAVVHITPIV